MKKSLSVGLYFQLLRLPITFYPASQSAQSFKKAYRIPEFHRKVSVAYRMSNVQRVILDWETK
jgi:hypothetical protein